MGYEEDFLRFCQSMLSDVDKRIRRARQRLALSSKESSVTIIFIYHEIFIFIIKNINLTFNLLFFNFKVSQPAPVKNNDEKVNVLTERINNLLLQVIY